MRKTKRSVPKGVKPVYKRLASGAKKLYWYHRATKNRVQAEPYTAAAFIEIAKLDDRAAKVAAIASGPVKSFAALWDEYHASPAFTERKPRTKKDYERVRDWIGRAADFAMPATMSESDVLKLRDKAFKEHRHRFSEYVLQVIHLVLEWGRPHGWLKGNPDGNPADKVKPIPKKNSVPNLNRAWKRQEIQNFFDHAPEVLKLPFALGAFAGMREGDMVALTWSAYDGETVQWIAGKNGEHCVAPATGLLKTLLDGAERGLAEVCTNSFGRPWKSENSFRSAFFKCVVKLEAQGLLDEGATFHGLRHWVAVNVRTVGGLNDFDVAAAIGDRSTAMAQVYGRDANRKIAQEAALRGLQDRYEAARMETELETVANDEKDFPVSHCNDLEAWPRIELGCADLQSAA